MPDTDEKVALCKTSLHSKCRFTWKSRDTGLLDHGKWFDLDQEETLQKEVDQQNKRYEGVIKHWLEYK